MSDRVLEHAREKLAEYRRDRSLSLEPVVELFFRAHQMGHTTAIREMCNYLPLFSYFCSWLVENRNRIQLPHLDIYLPSRMHQCAWNFHNLLEGCHINELALRGVVDSERNIILTRVEQNYFLTKFTINDEPVMQDITGRNLRMKTEAQRACRDSANHFILCFFREIGAGKVVDRNLVRKIVQDYILPSWEAWWYPMIEVSQERKKHKV